MNIAFLVSDVRSPSARYRALQYIPLLENAGCVCDVHEIAEGPWDRARLFTRMKEYDVVFLQKRLLSPVHRIILRKNAPVLVYDFDDAVMFRDSSRRNPHSLKRMNAFRGIVRTADAVIAGNRYLKSFAEKENPRTYVIPTSVDMKRYLKRPATPIHSPVVLGWIGSGSTLFYLERMKDVWDALYDGFPGVNLKIVGDTFFECHRMPVIRKQWKYEEEIQDLHSFDIGLMPLTDDPWSRGKCGFKLIQCMAVGVPVVCSPVGANRDIVTDGVNGFCAGDAREWVEKTGVLINDMTLRQEMGESARETVMKHYSLEGNGRILLELLVRLSGDKDSASVRGSRC